MAKNLRNDVELVISARNEAAKSIDEVLDSLEQLGNEAEKGFKGVFSDLITDSETMRQEQDKLREALKKVVEAEKQIADVEQQTTKLFKEKQAAIDKAKQNLAKLNDQYGELQRAATAARKPSQGLVDQFDKQQKKQTQLADSIAKVREELSRVGRNVEVGNVDERATQAIEKQRQKVEELGRTWRETTAQIAQAQSKLETSADEKTGADAIQKAEQERLDTLRKQRDAAYKLKVERGKEARSAKKNAKELKELKAAHQESIQQYEKLKTAVQEQTQVEREARRVRDEVSKSYRDQKKEVDRLIATAEKQAAAYEEVRAELEEFEAAQQDASTERQQKEYADLTAKLERLEDQYQQTTDKLERTQAQLDKASGPDPKAVQRFEKLQGSIAETEKEIKDETKAFEKLQKQMKEAGNDSKSLAADKERLSKASRQLEQRQEQLNNELGETSREARRAGREASRAGKQFRFWGDDSRQALSYIQRIRGELLAIGSAYVGVYAAGDAIRSIYDASVLTTKSVARLEQRFGKGSEQITQELEYIQQLSDRIAVSREVLQDEYTKFAAGIPKDVASMNDIRVIFEGFATGARAAGTSIEELRGIFKAIIQMVSKGQITMEELREQLGDNLPGAVPILADALGVTVEELDKMIENGEVAGDAVILLADKIREKYGKSLGTALESPQASFARLKNTLLDIRQEMGESGFIDTLVAGLREVVQTMRQPEFKEASRDLADGLAAAAKIAVSAVKNFETILAVLKAIVGIQLYKWAINAGGAFVGLGRSMFNSARAAKASRKGVNRLRFAIQALGKAVLVLPAVFYVGFNIGKILYDQFPIVRKFGLLIVDIMEKAIAKINFGWKKSQAYFSAGWKDIIIEVGKFILKVIPNAIAKVNDGLVGLAGFVSDSLQETLNEFNQGFRNLTDLAANRILGISPEDPSALRRELNALEFEYEKTVSGIEGRIGSLWAEIDKENQSGADGFKDIAEKIRADFEKALEEANPLKHQGNGDGEKYGEDFVKGLVDEFKGIEDELAEASADTLDERLALIERRYTEFLNKLQILSDRGALPPALQGAREQVQKLIALRKEQEKQKFIAEQTREVEQKINDLQQTRSEQIDRINEKYELGMINGKERAEQAAQANEAYIERMQSVIREAKELARANSNTELGGLVAGYDNFEEMERRRSKLDQIRALEERINAIVQTRDNRVEAINQLRESGLKGSGEAAKQIEAIYERTNTQLAGMIDKAVRFAKELGNPQLVARLEALRGNLDDLNQRMLDAQQINQSFASGFTNALEQFIRGTKSATQAFRQFASDFLAEIAKMIIQQLIFNAISGWTKSGTGGFGGFLSDLAGMQYHDGGVVGSGGTDRLVNPLWFTNALRYHSGGVAGLKPNEVPAVLEQGEEVLTRDDPRHRANGGTTNGGPMSVKVVNAIDSSSVLQEGMNTSAGQKTILNFMRANKKQIKSVLS